MNTFELPVGYTVTTPQGRTIETLSAEEMAEDFPDMLMECSDAIDELFTPQGVQSVVKAHWVLPIV